MGRWVDGWRHAGMDGAPCSRQFRHVSDDFADCASEADDCSSLCLNNESREILRHPRSEGNVQDQMSHSARLPATFTASS